MLVEHFQRICSFQFASELPACGDSVSSNDWPAYLEADDAPVSKFKKIFEKLATVTVMLFEKKQTEPKNINNEKSQANLPRT